MKAWSKKNCFLSGLMVFCLCSFSLAAAGWAEDYPTKPVKVICPWGAGGSTDIVCRTITSAMSRYFPEPMVVINKAGAGGVVGTSEALRSEPDGYTVLCNSYSAFVTQPHMQDVPYTPDDYIVVMQMTMEPRVLSAYPGSPFNDLKEMMAYAKGNPGAVKIGFSGIGTTGHLAMVQLEKDFGVTLKLVPFQGGGPTKTALLGGHVDAAPLNPPEARSLLAGGKIKALAAMSPKRIEGLPDVPTSAEQGYPVESLFESFIFLPKGTPSDRVQLIHDAFKKCLEDKTVMKMAAALELGITYRDGPSARAELDKFYALYGKLIKELGLSKDKK